MLKFCVLGSGISYTLSPLIHKTAFRALGADADYFVEDIPSGELGENIVRIKKTYDGFNVTKPFKQDIMLYLDGIDCKVDAVNTVTVRGGEHIGSNTDVFGFASALRDLAGDVRGMRTLVLGAGGAAEAAVCALTDAGADVAIYNRTPERAIGLATRYKAAPVSSVKGLKPELLVNCTSVGNDGVTSPIPDGLDMSALRYGYDLVYSPAHTAFMSDCEKAGAKTAGGLSMLIYQAIAADGIFLGCEPPAELYEEIRKTLEKELS